jgi:rhamnulokinase
MGISHNSVHSAAVFLAVDLGASSGRVLACGWNGNAFSFEEVHRFPNGGVRVGASLYWDALGIWSGIQNGLRKYSAGSQRIPAGVGIDAWGVDFGLLDKQGRLIGNPYHYRDARTDGLPEMISGRIDGAMLFRATGVQSMAINTSFQLASMAMSGDEQLSLAQTLLPIPDLFQYFLCGEKQAEFTEATTMQLYDLKRREWSSAVLRGLGVAESLFPPVCMPGTVLGKVLPQVIGDCGFDGGFPAIAVASHDTASAVAAIPNLDDRSVFLSCGTWSLMGTAVSEPQISDEALRLGFTNEGAADGGVLLIRNLTGLWILQECMRIWAAAGKVIVWEEIEEAAVGAKPFRSLIDPNAAAFQAPADMPATMAAWCIASHQPAPESPAEAARCVFESLSLSYRATLHDIERLTGRTIEAVRLVGGGAKNHFLCQMTADACQRPVVAGPVEAAAMGNALVQVVATKHLASLDQGRSALLDSCEYWTFVPRAGAEWEEAAERFGELKKKRGEAGRIAVHAKQTNTVQV